MKGGTLFDSAFGIESEMSSEEFENELIPKISEILSVAFPGNYERQKIRKSGNRISFCAPCCGDSMINDRKKRGNISLSGKWAGMYKCYNCGMFIPVTKFLEKYGKELSINGIDYVNKHKSGLETSSGIFTGADMLYDMEFIESLCIDRDSFLRNMNLNEIIPGGEAYEYLMSRNQTSFENFLADPRNRRIFCLNLTMNGKIAGVQSRELGKTSRPKYMTYGLDKIYSDLIGTECQEIPDDVLSLSMIFNILRVDFSKPITILEGPMDSYLIKNSIALCGAGKNISIPYSVRYMFDDDETGRKHSISKLNSGSKVFMWDSFKRDIGLPYRKKWDYNDVVNWCKSNMIKIPDLDPYFTNDPFDMLFL